MRALLHCSSGQAGLGALLALGLAGCGGPVATGLAARDVRGRSRCIIVSGRPNGVPVPLARIAPRLEACHEAGEIGAGSGYASFALAVGQAGEVTSVNLSPAGLSASTAGCVRRALAGLSFNPPEGGKGEVSGALAFAGTEGAVEEAPETPPPALALGGMEAAGGGGMLQQGVLPLIVLLPSFTPEVGLVHELGRGLERCAAPGDAPARVAVAARVEATGAVVEVSVRLEGAGRDALVGCLRDALGALTLPSRPGALAEQITATFEVGRGRVALVR